MISAHSGNRHRLAALTAFCLALLLGAAPAALAVPILPESEDPALGTPGTGTIPAPVVQSSGGADWTDGVLVGAIAFALAIAAIALIAAVRNPSPDPTPHA
jgi:hypothetical protein